MSNFDQSKSTGICLKPLLAPILEKYFATCIFAKVSSALERWKYSCCIGLFKLRGSRMRRELFSFSTITWEFTYSINSQTGLMIPILVILSTSAFNLFFNAKRIFLGGLTMGELNDEQLCGVLCSKFQFHLKQSWYFPRKDGRLISKSTWFVEVSHSYQHTELLENFVCYNEQYWKHCIFVSNRGYELAYNRYARVVGRRSNWGWLQLWTLMKFVIYSFGEYIYLGVWVNFIIDHVTVSV